MIGDNTADRWVGIGHRTSPEPMDALPDAETAIQAVEQVRAALQASGWALSREAWLDSSGTLVSVNDVETRVSCCVRRGLDITPGLLGAIAQLNQSDPSGRYWLVEGSGPQDGWTLVWAASVPHPWTSAIHLQRAVYSCLVERAPWIQEFASELTVFGGRAAAKPTEQTWERLGYELWELTAVRPCLTQKATWPIGSHPMGQGLGADSRSAVVHDQGDEAIGGSHCWSSFLLPPLPIPIHTAT